jgi:hypothetical protein
VGAGEEIIDSMLFVLPKMRVSVGGTQAHRPAPAAEDPPGLREPKDQANPGQIAGTGGVLLTTTEQKALPAPGPSVRSVCRGAPAVSSSGRGTNQGSGNLVYMLYEPGNDFSSEQQGLFPLDLGEGRGSSMSPREGKRPQTSEARFVDG